MAVTTMGLIAAAAVTAGVSAANKPKMPDAGPMPSAPSMADANAKAKADIDAKRKGAAPTLLTGGSGLQDVAPTQKKSLLGQ